MSETSLQLGRYGGGLALTGPTLSSALTIHTPAQLRSSLAASPHITLVTKAEYRSLHRPAPPSIDLSHLHIVGLGGQPSRGLYWLVVVWNHANQWRRSVGLAAKQFHITLSHDDNHEADKGILSLIGGDEEVKRTFQTMSEDGMDQVLASGSTRLHLELAEIMAVMYPTSYKAIIRLADFHLTVNPKLAALAYAQALPLNPALTDYIARRMRKLMTLVQWGPLLSEEELSSLPCSLRPLLTKAWSAETRSLANTTLCTASVDPRTRFLFQGDLELPRFFSWILPQRLAVSSTPRRESDVDILAQMGVTTVLTLTEEQPLEAPWFAFRASIRNIFVPVENYHAPSIAEMDLILDRFRTDPDGVWLIHCGGGKGRAGTVAACLLVMHGLGSNDEVSATPQLNKTDVLALLRRMRPGSIETVVQENFLDDWIGHRWRLAYTGRPELGEEPTLEPLRQILDPTTYPTGLGAEKVKVAVLVGLPGSGKSWLCHAIQKRRPAGKTVVISQDETRSRSACETVLGNRYDDDMLVILDRCNPDAAERRSWLDLIRPGRKPIAIHLDYSREVCQRRINGRLDHPTIRTGDSANAIEQMARLMQPPRVDEGFGAIMTVSSTAAAWEAVLLLGGARLGVTRFPRTPHLLNLGAVAADDLIRDDATVDVQGTLVVEEKVDGANLGFYLAPADPGDEGQGPDAFKIIVQNRTHVVDLSDPNHIHPQFRALRPWLASHEHALRRILHRDDQFPDRFTLYGEWMAARHSIHYTHLPDLFLAFDLLDRTSGRFASREMLARLLQGSSIHQVPELTDGGTIWDELGARKLSAADLKRLVATESRYYDGPVEGVYVRFENLDRTETVARGKVVRGDFIQGEKHWTRRHLILNQVKRPDEE